MKRILALIDFTDATPEILHVGRELARALKARIYFIHVADPGFDYSEDILREDRSREKTANELRGKHRRLRLFATVTEKMGIDAIALLVKGSPVKKALQELERLKPDLVIVGSHGRSRLYHLLPGNVGSIVASRARCPVLIVRARGEGEKPPA